MSVSERVDFIHKTICRAGFLMVCQLVNKKLRRSDLQEVVEKLELALSETKLLIQNTNKKDNTHENNTTEK